MDITQILQSADAGDSTARSELIQAVYHDLRQMAAGKMASERQDHTLSATALVHEVSMKILSDADVPTENRGQFFAYASKAMRNFLVDHARTRGRQKRGGDRKRVMVEEAMIACEQQSEDLLALNEAIDALAKLQPQGPGGRNAVFLAACLFKRSLLHWTSPSRPSSVIGTSQRPG